MSKLRICLGAGHGLYTSGKRFMKSLDPTETREWTVNDRIVSKVIAKLKDYKGVETLRVDDPSGKSDISLGARVRAVNNFKPDIFISFHHDAGISGGTGGGLSVHIAGNASNKSKTYATKLYKELIDHTGLKGNRANGVQTNNFYVIKNVSCPSMLVEHGFMDSRTDVPIILSEKFAEDAAKGHLSFLVKEFSLIKVGGSDLVTDPVEAGSSVLPMELLRMGSRGPLVKRLQQDLLLLNFEVGEADGIFGIKTEVGVMQLQSKAKLDIDGIVGQDTFVAIKIMLEELRKEPDKYYRVSVGLFGMEENAQKIQEQLKKDGYDTFIKIEDRK